MRNSSNYSSLTGLSLLSALAALVAGISMYPSFDARAQYFPLSIQSLIESRGEFATALVFVATAGGALIVAGIASMQAFSYSRARNPIPGSILIIAGAGFMLSAALGQPALGILAAAADLSAAEARTHAATAYPWASGSQSTLLLFGLGSLALGLLALIVVMLKARAFSRLTIALALALPVVMWLVIALTIEGAPLVWLVPGLPVAVWTVGLGLFLVFTGRVTSPVSKATAYQLAGAECESTALAWLSNSNVPRTRNFRTALDRAAFNTQTVKCFRSKGSLFQKLKRISRDG